MTVMRGALQRLKVTIVCLGPDDVEMKCNCDAR